MEHLKSEDNETEELKTEVFISVECTLNPDVTNVLTQLSKKFRKELEELIGVQVIDKNRIIGKCHQIITARTKIQDLIASMVNSEKGEEDRSEIRKGNQVDPTSEKTKGDKSETRNSTYIESTLKFGEDDRSETRKGGDSELMSETVEGKRSETRKGTNGYPTSGSVGGARGKTRKVSLSDSTSEEMEGERNEIKRRAYSDSALNIGEVERSETRKGSHSELMSETVEGKRSEISLGVSTAEKLETKGEEHNDDTKAKQHYDNSKQNAAEEEHSSEKFMEEAHSISMGSCQHHGCSIRSKAYQFKKSIIDFIVKYLWKQFENESLGHQFFIAYDEKGESASVECCGLDADDAENNMQIFELYYEETEDNLCHKELQFLPEAYHIYSNQSLDGMKCVIQRKSTDKMTVVCEKNEAAHILAQLHQIGTIDGHLKSSSAQSHHMTSAAEMPVTHQDHEKMKPCSELDAHTVEFQVTNPYYWSHITQISESFNTELDKLLTEKHVTLHDCCGRLELKGRSIDNIRCIQRHIQRYYTLMSPKLKSVKLNPASFDIVLLMKPYPHITVYNDDDGDAILVGECEIIDRIIKEAGITVAKTELRREAGRGERATQEMPVSDASQQSGVVSACKIPCGFLINSYTEVFIHKSNITKLHVDAIVNAANERLQHGAGVAKAISDAASPMLKEEGDQIIKRSGPIDVSKTVVTSAGRLPCKAVIHAVGPRWPSDHDKVKENYCLHMLYDTFMNAMITADEKGFTSLGIPPISSGIFGVPKDEVARIMCEVVTRVRTGKLREIHFVDITEDLLLQIGSNLLQLSKQGTHDDLHPVIELDQDAVSSTLRKCMERKQRQLIIHNRVKTFLRVAEITQVKADAIVCSNDVALSCSTGVAKTIADLAGKEYKKSCKQRATSKNLQPTDVVSIKAGDLGIIINTITPLKSRIGGLFKNYDDGHFKELLYETLHKAIDEARKLEIRCLAMSPLGAGQKDVPKQLVANTLCQALIDNLRTDTRIEEVHIVDKNTEILELIRNEFEKNSIYVKYDDDTEINTQPVVSTGSTDQAAKSSTSNDSSTVNNFDASDVDPLVASSDSKVMKDEAEADKPVVYSSSYRKNRIDYKKQVEGETSDAASASDTTATSNNEDEKPNPEMCVICMGDLDNPKQLSKCKHKFCKSCIDESFQRCGPKCPSCGELYGALTGTQPRGGRMDVRRDRYLHLPGYSNAGTITIQYNIPSGIQGPEHPNPGQYCSGTSRTAYLPDTREGNNVLKLLRKAFDARLIFTVGRSATTGCDNAVVWNDIHHKTSLTGGPQNYGYPDPTYLKRVQDELASKGIK